MAAKFKKGVDLSGQRAVNAADPSANTDLVTKQYADALVRGLDWKFEVVAASTGNVSLSAPGTTLDGVTLSAGMQTIPGVGTVTRILLKDQTAPAENGIWDWNGAAAALTRSTDADSGQELSGSTTTVQRGTVNADRVYRVNTDDTITLGTTAVTWAQVGGASAPYTAGNGLTLTGQAFSVNAGTGIIADGTSTRVDTSVVSRKYAADCVATTNPQTFTHNLGTDIQCSVWEANEMVYPDVTKAANTVTIDWGSAPTAAQYRVVVQG